MSNLFHRFAVVLLLISGLLMIAQPLGGVGAGQAMLPNGLAQPGPAAWSVVRHHQFMLALVGGALALSAFIPALRPSAIGLALLAKVGFLVISLAADSPAQALSRSGWVEAGLLCMLLLAGGVFLREAVQEARWDSKLPRRSEV